MADHCQFCDIRRPDGGTKMIMNSEDWIEFCPKCGKKEGLIRVPDHPEVKTLDDLFNHIDAKKEN